MSKKRGITHKTTKRHTCDECKRPIYKGHVAATFLDQANDGTCRTGYICYRCCANPYTAAN